MKESPRSLQQPLVWGAVTFVLGASVAIQDNSIPYYLLLTLGVGTLFLAHWRRTSVAVLVPLVFLLSGLFVGASDQPQDESISRVFNGKLPEAPVVVEALVRQGPQLTAKNETYIIDVLGVAEGPRPNRLHRASGTIRLTLSGTGRKPCAQVGDRIRALTRLRRPRPATYLGDHSPLRYAQIGGWNLRGWVSHKEQCIVISPGFRRKWVHKLGLLRQKFQAKINAALPSRTAAVVRALVTGDRSKVAGDTQIAFQRSGLAHLMAVSGFHLGVVVWLWLTLIERAFRYWPRIAFDYGSRRAAAVCAVPFSILFPLFVGAPASATRAGLMSLLVLIGYVSHRKVQGWNVVATAVLLMTAYDVRNLWSPGFQLSFSAVLSLIYLPQRIERRIGIQPRVWSFGPRFLWGSVIASFAATLGTAPFMLTHFGNISIIGLIANIPATVLAAVAVPLALLGGTLGLIYTPAGDFLIWLAGYPTEGLILIAAIASSVPHATLVLPAPTFLEGALYVGLLSLGTAARINRRRWYLIACLLTTLLASILWAPFSRLWSQETTVSFLPVGQGDGMVVELPGGKVVVIDVGPGGRHGRIGQTVVADYLRHRRIFSIDLLVISHLHEDHVGGLSKLTEVVSIRHLWWTGDGRHADSETVRRLNNFEHRPIRPGLEYTSGPATLKILAPAKPLGDELSVNDASIVVLLRHGQRTVLFTGDIEANGEFLVTSKLSQELDHQRVDVLKVAHHGSRTSSTRTFLATIRPVHAVISCGFKNRFRFPHRETLSRLGEQGTQTWRTDLDGAVTVQTDGSTLTISGYIKNRLN